MLKKNSGCVCSTANCEQCFPRRTHRRRPVPPSQLSAGRKRYLASVRRKQPHSPFSHGVSQMKRICFTIVMACAALAGTARADGWGRVLPYSLTANTPARQVNLVGPGTAGPVQGPVQGPVVQAPIQNDGYPFTDRCGCATSSCCDNVWAGYTGPGCGWGHKLLHHAHGCGHKLFHHGHGCGKCGHHLGLGLGLHHGKHCGSCNTCDPCGSGGIGCINSFAGGSCCGGAGGFGHGLLHGWGGCGCGHHKFGHLRRLCGLDCGDGCGETIGASAGCNCGVHGSPVQNGKVMHPPVPSTEPTPAPETIPAAPEPAEKSAFRPFAAPFLRAGF